MAGLFKIEIEIERPHVITLESLVVKTTLTNIGDSPLATDGTMLSSPFHYELVDPGSGEILQRISQAAYRSRQCRDGRAPRDGSPRILGPGDVASVRDDLVYYAASSILPRRYHLIAIHGHGENALRSGPLEIEVEAPKPNASAWFYCPTEQVFCSALAHQSEGSAKLYQGQAPQLDPNDGVLFFRNCDGLQNVDALALAYQVGYSDNGRWFAWLSSGTLGALRGWGSGISARIAPTPLAATDASLLERGFQMADGSALFFALDLIGGGLEKIDIRGTSVDVQSFPSPWGAPPKRVLSRYSVEQAPHIDLVWTEAEGDDTRILTARFPLDDPRNMSRPQRLCQETAPLADFNVAPLAEESPLELHCLWGPDGAEGLMTYARCGLKADGANEEKSFFFAKPPLPNHWAISADGGESVVVVASDDSAIYWLNPVSEQLQIMANADHACELRLARTLTGDFWASWRDPAEGYRFRRLPRP